MGYDVLTNGYVSMDHIIKVSSPVRVGYTSLVTNPDNAAIRYGGCSVNIATALSKLGLKTMPFLRVGPDWEENGFRDFLMDAGVSLEGTTVLEKETTSTCYLLQDNNNDHYTVYYPGSMDKKYAQPLPDRFFEGTRLGVIAVGSRPDNEYFLEQCKKHQVPVAFSMKDDFDAFPTDFLRELLCESKIVFMNEVESDIIKEKYELASIKDLLAMGQAEILVTTLGKDGSICYERCESGIREYRTGVCRVEQVTDATGTGDAFVSGFLYGYLHGKPTEECCRFGTVLAAFVLQKEGCCTNIPSEEVLQKRVSQFTETGK